MRRRDFVTMFVSAVAGAVIWPPFATAQSDRLPRVAVLDWGTAKSNRLLPFQNALRSLGYVQGKNVQVDYYYAEGQADRAQASATEIVGNTANVIVAFATPAALAVKKATSTIPIVVGTSDPVGAGLVSNLARPGGNITGISSMMPDLESKRLELLRELLPKLDRVAFLGSKQDPVAVIFAREAQVAAQSIGMHMQLAIISGHVEISAAFARMARDRVGAVIVQPLFVNNAAAASEVARLALGHRLAAISNFAHFPKSGGLLSYGAHSDFSRRTAATYVDRILKGASPGDLPVMQPTTFELVINLKTAKALGLTIPPSVLARADEVIE